MKKLYTLIILLIPYVGFSQNYQEIIVEQSSYNFEIIGDGFIVASYSGDGSKFSKYNLDGEFIFNFYSGQFGSDISFIQNSVGNFIVLYGSGFNVDFGIRFQEFSDFGGLVFDIPPYFQMSTIEENWGDISFELAERDAIIDNVDEYLIISSIDTNRYSFNEWLDASLIYSDSFEAFKVSYDWENVEYLNISNGIINDIDNDTASPPTSYKYFINHYNDSNNNVLFFMHRIDEFGIEGTESKLIITKTNYNLEFINETELNIDASVYINASIYPKFFVSDDDNYILTYAKENDSTLSLDVFLQKYNQEGDLIWEKSFGGYEDDQVFNCIELINGNFILAAKFGSDQIGGNNSRLALIELNSSGELIDELSFIIDNNETNNNQETIHSIRAYNDSFIALIEHDGINRLLIFENSEPSQIKENFIDKNSFKIYNILGKESSIVRNQPLIKIYENGLVEKVLIIE
jgi:hypothetical protein